MTMVSVAFCLLLSGQFMAKLLFLRCCVSTSQTDFYIAGFLPR